LARQPERIAILRALNLGDLLVAVPALRAMRQQFPHAEITLIGLPWAAAFVERYRSFLDRFVAFPGYPGLPEGEGNPMHVAQFLCEQRDYHYDLVVQMHGSGTISNMVAQALGGRISAGYHTGVHPVGLNIAALYPDQQHEIVRNLGLAVLLGCTDLRTQLEFPLCAADDSEANALLSELPDWHNHQQQRVRDRSRLLVGIHPGARSPARRWPAAYFAALADELASRFAAHVVVTGSAGEQASVQSVVAAMKMPALDLAGRTSLGGLAGLLSKLDLFISNDTGPVHLACALHCPSVTIFGPAEYERWAPLDHGLHPTVRHAVKCSPCGYWECPIDHRCLHRLTPAMVLRVAERVIHETTENPDLAYSRQLSELSGAN
jgi:ADP-heptose:LPS heptosyltransferase